MSGMVVEGKRGPQKLSYPAVAKGGGSPLLVAILAFQLAAKIHPGIHHAIWTCIPNIPMPKWRIIVPACSLSVESSAWILLGYSSSKAKLDYGGFNLKSIFISQRSSQEFSLRICLQADVRKHTHDQVEKCPNHTESWAEVSFFEWSSIDCFMSYFRQ